MATRDHLLQPKIFRSWQIPKGSFPSLISVDQWLPSASDLCIFTLGTWSTSSHKCAGLWPGVRGVTEMLKKIKLLSLYNTLQSTFLEKSYIQLLQNCFHLTEIQNNRGKKIQLTIQSSESREQFLLKWSRLQNVNVLRTQNCMFEQLAVTWKALI